VVQCPAELALTDFPVPATSTLLSQTEAADCPRPLCVVHPGIYRHSLLIEIVLKTIESRIQCRMLHTVPPEKAD